MSSLNSLINYSTLFIHQRHELAEFIGFETRNKYSIETEQGMQVGFAAEQHKGILGFLSRYFLGHWRRFEIFIFDNQRQLVLKAVHPFRWFFQRLEVYSPQGSFLGAFQQRFSFLTKKFDVQNSNALVLMSVASPVWRIWTFPFIKNTKEVARIEKKWSGFLSEGFTDKDKFRISFSDPTLPENERLLLLVGALFIDLQYFEKKASN